MKITACIQSGMTNLEEKKNYFNSLAALTLSNLGNFPESVKELD